MPTNRVLIPGSTRKTEILRFIRIKLMAYRKRKNRVLSLAFWYEIRSYVYSKVARLVERIEDRYHLFLSAMPLHLLACVKSLTLALSALERLSAEIGIFCLGSRHCGLPGPFKHLFSYLATIGSHFSATASKYLCCLDKSRRAILLCCIAHWLVARGGTKLKGARPLKVLMESTRPQKDI